MARDEPPYPAGETYMAPAYVSASNVHPISGARAPVARLPAPGDKMRLKIGGPVMLVNAIELVREPRVEVCYLSGGLVCTESVAVECLEFVDD